MTTRPPLHSAPARPGAYRFTLTTFILFVLALFMLGIVTAAVAASTTGSYVPGHFSFVTIGSGQRIGPSHYGCDNASDTAPGTWTAITTGASSSGTFTLAGAAVGDSCEYAAGAAVAATNQGIIVTCIVTATGTVRERLVNATGATITPKAGRRCARLLGSGS